MEEFELSYFIGATTIVVLVTFLWNRKVKLWNFYDTHRSECLKQTNINSLDRKAWEKIASDQCDFLLQNTSLRLFRFEVEYLRQKLIDNQYELCIPDSQATSMPVNSQFVATTEIIYKDKEQHCRNHLSKTYRSEMQYIGFYLFLNAKRYNRYKIEDNEPGYTQKRVITKRKEKDTNTTN